MEKENLKLDRETAISIYDSSPDFFKETLEQTFGKECFCKNIMEIIKTWQDVLDYNGVTEKFLFNSNDTKDEIAYKKLKLICKTFNEEWTPNWKDSNQHKYYPCFKVAPSGFGFSASAYICAISLTAVSSRLCLKSRELSNYVGTQFIDIFNDYLL